MITFVRGAVTRRGWLKQKMSSIVLPPEVIDAMSTRPESLAEFEAKDQGSFSDDDLDDFF